MTPVLRGCEDTTRLMHADKKGCQALFLAALRPETGPGTLSCATLGSMNLKNAHIAITGASRGIGWALAQTAAQRGAHLYLISRTVDEHVEKALNHLGAPSVTQIACDMGDPQEVRHLIERLNSYPVDILVNNAGVLTGGLLENQTIEEINQVFQVNTISAIELTRGLLPQMLVRQRGLIVNNASVSALMHFPGATTYAATKAALWAFTNSLRRELKGTGVGTLTLITPGVKTKMFDEIQDKYGKNIDFSSPHMSPQEYADQVMSAIEREDTFLYPKGSTRVGLWVAQNLPWLFEKVISNRFHR